MSVSPVPSSAQQLPRHLDRNDQGIRSALNNFVDQVGRQATREMGPSSGEAFYTMKPNSGPDADYAVTNLNEQLLDNAKRGRPVPDEQLIASFVQKNYTVNNDGFLGSKMASAPTLVQLNGLADALCSAYGLDPAKANVTSADPYS